MTLLREMSHEYKNLDNYVDGSVYVSGALSLLLRLSRWAGVAPLHIQRAGAGWRIMVSPTLATLEKIVMTLLNIICFMALIFDLRQEHGKRVRVGVTFMTTFLWVLDISLVMLHASLAVYAGPARMENLKQVLKQLHQVKSDLNISDPPSKTENIQSIVIVVVMLWTATVTFMVNAINFRRKVQDNITCIIMSSYVATFYLGNLRGMLLILQWCAAVLAALAAGAAINENLLRLRYSHLMPERKSGLEGVMKTRWSVSTLVDSITRLEDIPAKESIGYEFTTYRSQAQATIRRLALSHERLNKMIRETNDANGVVVVTILASTSFRLVYNGYLMLIEAVNFENEKNHYGLSSVIAILGVLIILVTTLILIIEPCHRIQIQRKYTEVLLSQLIVHLAPESERLSKELDQFAKQLALDNAQFSLVGVDTLARPLLATILGGVTTFLVIVIQFQTV